MKGRPMFHLEVRVYENGNLIRGFSTPRRFQDIMWAESYFQYLQFLAGKWYPIFKRWCVGEDALPEDNIKMGATWFIYHCKPVWAKQNLSSEEAIVIYEMCRSQYYLDSTNPKTDEVITYYTMVKKSAEY